MSEAPELLDQLMADGFVLRAFMLQVMVELAKDHDNQKAWVKSFIESMHQRIDSHESYMGEDGQEFPIHELARSQIDSVALTLKQIIR